MTPQVPPVSPPDYRQYRRTIECDRAAATKRAYDAIDRRYTLPRWHDENEAACGELRGILNELTGQAAIDAILALVGRIQSK